MTQANPDRESGTIAHSEPIANTERSTYQYGPQPWRDPGVLKELYCNRELSQAEIAALWDISQSCVWKWLDRFDIPTRPPMDERDPSISKSRVGKGKVQFKVPQGDGEWANFYRHEIVCLLAEDDDGGDWAYPASEVFGENHVHHEAAAPVAIDVPANLTPLSLREHFHLHGSAPPTIKRVEETLGEIFDEYDGEPDPDEFELTDEEIHRLEEASRAISGD